MPNDNDRLSRIEKNLEEYTALFYKWLDEQRTEARATKKEHEMRMIEHEKRIQLNEEWIARLSEIQTDIGRILRSMNGKLNDHEDRLSSAGI